MSTTRKRKKNLIVSYKGLSDDLKELFKEAYPDGHTNHLQKIIKPNGEPIFVVPLETDDTAYMIKFEVKIDTLGDDLDKALFDEEDETKEEEFAPLSEAIDKEESNTSHQERVLKHGSYEDVLAEESEREKVNLDIDTEGLKEAFADDDDEVDSYERDDDEDDEMEPSDDDLRGIEDEFLDAENPPLDATIPDEELAVTPAPKRTSSKKSATEKPAAAKKTRTATKTTKKK